MNRAATDTTLRDWRYGQPQAERLCADLLQVEGFSDIDPQCPLGGPDGRKDILCTRNGQNWLAAVYFPPTHMAFKDIKEKFCHDFEGVAKHSRQGFVFLTNQPITPGKREDLCHHAGPAPVELYHLERIRSILDSPKGYGFRLEYLRIPMTEEDQHSFWSTMKDDIIGRLDRQEFHLLDLRRKMDMMLERDMPREQRERHASSLIDSLEVMFAKSAPGGRQIDIITKVFEGDTLLAEKVFTNISAANTVSSPVEFKNLRIEIVAHPVGGGAFRQAQTSI
jgi:hypothetical protein